MGVNGNLTFTDSGASKKLIAIARSGENSEGLHIWGDLEVLSGVIEAKASTAGGATASSATSVGVNATGTITVSGGTNGLSFTADADYIKSTGVSVDGETISSDKYTSASGSTIVTLKPSYLQTLSNGQHTLRLEFTDGYSETSFTLSGGEIPATGNDSQMLLWLGIALLAATGLRQVYPQPQETPERIK